MLIVLIIELLSFLSSLHSRFLTDQEIQLFAFKQLVSRGARHGRERLFRQLVLVLRTAAFDESHGFESGGAGGQFVGLMRMVSLASVDLGVGISCLPNPNIFLVFFGVLVGVGYGVSEGRMVFCAGC